MRAILCLAMLMSCHGDDGDPSDPPPNADDVAPTDTDTGDDDDDDTSTPSDTGTTPPPAICDEVVCHYVRAGADPGGDGTSWTSAWTELPAALERGQAYLVAAGAYPGYTFDDPTDGTETITVQRATVADHGTDDGWDDGFDGSADFGPLELDEPFYVLDGSGRGLVVRGTFQGTAVSVDSDEVTLQSLDIDGAFAEDGGNHSDGACTGLDVSGSNVVVEDCEVHDAADDGVVVSNATGIVFDGNEVHALHACGSDDGCGPCYNGHSDGLELFNVKSSVFRRNLVYDVRSTATVFFGNWGAPAEYNEDLLIENNLFYAPEVGLVVYIHYANRIQFLHNVVWGVHQGAYGGLSVGPEVTDLELYDNILLSVNFTHTGGTFDPTEHRGDHNLFGVDLGQWEAGPDDLVAADPGFVGIPDVEGSAVAAPRPEDFVPRTDSPVVDAGIAGVSGVTFPTSDFFGAPRDDGLPDIGAVELP